MTQDQFTQVSKKFSDIPAEDFTINIELFLQTFTNVELIRQNWIVSKAPSPVRELRFPDVLSDALPLRHTLFLFLEYIEGYKRRSGATSLLFTLYSLLFTLYSLLCTLYSLLFILYSLLFTLYSLLFTLYSLLFTLYSLLFICICICICICIIFFDCFGDTKDPTELHLYSLLFTLYSLFVFVFV